MFWLQRLGLPRISKQGFRVVSPVQVNHNPTRTIRPQRNDSATMTSTHSQPFTAATTTRTLPTMMLLLMIILVNLQVLTVFGMAWTSPSSSSSSSTPRHNRSSSTTRLQMNFLSDIGDALTGGKLVRQEAPPKYGQPLGTLSDDVLTLAIQERILTLTGEDFDVYEIDSDNNNAESQYIRVRGAMLSLTQDKMRIIDSMTNEVLAGLERKFVALVPTYEIYRGNFNEKIGWLEKATIALTETFEFHVEGGFGPFKPPAAYKLEGDFLERRFVMKNEKGEAVAKITEDRLLEFDNMNHYAIRIAPNMDPALVIACCCAIDEELEEEHQKRREHQAKR